MFKKNLVVLSTGLLCVFSFGGLTYADENTSTNVTNVDTSRSNIDTTSTFDEVTIGASQYEIIVKNDDAFTGLEFVESYTLPEMSSGTKTLLLRSLTSLVVSVITGDGFYTLETFKDAFIEVCASYGLDITEDFLNSLDKYTSTYLDDEFENSETNIILNSIYISLGFIIILLILLWQGGGSF